MTTIYDDCFLVMSAYGIQRMTKRRGQLNAGEVAVKVRLHVPEKAFEEPDVQAVINVPESALIRPAIEAVVVEDNP